MLVSGMDFRTPSQNPGDNKRILTCRYHALEAFLLRPIVTPLNVAKRDRDETVVSKILDHDFSDPKNKL